MTRTCFLLLLCFAGLGAFGQSMSTPYSVYAIGDIDHRLYNFNAGMGYTGIGMKSSLFTSGNNPASITGMERSFFMFDVHAAGRTVVYRGNNIDASNNRNRDFTIKRLALSTKINSFWGSGIGFRQFSSVNYSFQRARAVEGSNDRYTLSYKGDGGLNEYYWNNGFSIGKHLSAGITASFIAGPINQTEVVTGFSGDDIESVRRDYYANGRLEYGLIYTRALGKKWEGSLGGRFSKETKMNYERTLSVTSGNNAIAEEEFLSYHRFRLPAAFGLGLSMVNKKGTTLAADFSHDDWNSLDVKGAGWRLVNSNRYSAGVEFSSAVNDRRKDLVRKALQFGAFLNQSYLRVNNRQINEWGLTAGLSRTYRKGLMLGASLEGGMRGTAAAGLIRESYFQLRFSFSYRDFLMSKGRKYD
ncbi:MAG TPA: hypothetical protein VFR58_08390 [Flavisolibacter sp.]|nr:hypothetical protein [Flavisolibacter sp.]